MTTAFFYEMTFEGRNLFAILMKMIGRSVF